MHNTWCIHMYTLYEQREWKKQVVVDSQLLQEAIMCLRKDVLCRIVLLQLEHFAPAEKLRMLEVHSAFRVPVPRPSQPLTKDCNHAKRGRMFVRVVKAAGWQVAERLHIASHRFTLLSSFMAHCFEGPSTGCRALAKAQGESADHGMENGSKWIKT